MANVNSLSDYTQTTVAQPTGPSTESTFDLALMAPVIRELVVDGFIDEPQLQKDITSARSFFRGNEVFKTDRLLDDLKFGQQIRVNIVKDQNPLDLVKKDAIEYDAIDSCHDQIDLDCTVPCLNTLPEFEHIVFRFDTEYAYGVRACDKNKDFYDFGFFTKQYAKSREAERFVRELDLWNTAIKGLIAAPATTVDAKLAGTHATHYWQNQGSVATNARGLVAEAYWYMVNSFQGLNPTVFLAAEAAQEIIESVETFAPYSINFTNTYVNTFEQWDIPGFMVADAARKVLGLPANVSVVVMKRSPWLTYAGTGAYTGTVTSQYPLWNEDGSKQYIAILDPRVAYQVAKDGYHLVINPYDCDKLIRGMIDTEYVGSGITFPQYGLIIEFDATEYK